MLADFLNRINDPMATIPVVLLSATGLYFTIRTKGAQFRLIGEMFRLLTDGCPTARQAPAGLEPVYDASTCPEIADETECWRRE